jgi:hypothetical protein
VAPARLTVRHSGRLVVQADVAAPADFALAAGLTYDAEIQPSGSREAVKRQIRLAPENGQTIELALEK